MARAAVDAAPATAEAALRAAAARLQAAGVDSPRLDARLLLAAAMAADGAAAAPAVALSRLDRPLPAAAARRFERLLARRLRREPVSRILGRREFWSLTFRVTPETLDPRPDSETLVEAVLAEVADRNAPLRLLDLGTGTGCLLLALLSELPRATGVGVDISSAACKVATENAAMLGLAGRTQFAVADWARGVAGPFNVIVTNPPYIREGDFDALAPEVAGYEPRRALVGGTDGLDAYRAIVPRLRELLASGGRVALEVGDGRQAGAVTGLLREHGFSKIDVRPDLAGRERCIIAGVRAR